MYNQSPSVIRRPQSDIVPIKSAVLITCFTGSIAPSCASMRIADVANIQLSVRFIVKVGDCQLKKTFELYKSIIGITSASLWKSISAMLFVHWLFLQPVVYGIIGPNPDERTD
jgi:hypothetical protein